MLVGFHGVLSHSAGTDLPADLVVANDPEYMGDQVNDVATTAAGVFYRITIVVASLASVPLLIIAGAGS